MEVYECKNCHSSLLIGLNTNWSISNQCFKIFLCKTCQNKNCNTSILDCCKYCNEHLDILSNWKLSNVKKKKYICNKCIKDINNYEYKFKINQKQKLKNHNNIARIINYLKLKNEIIINYGRKCSFCFEDNICKLNIDHIYFKEKKEKTISLYKNLIKNNYPTDNYRLLCFNCNCSLSKFGFSPNQLIKSNFCYFCNELLNDNNSFKNLNFNVCKYCSTLNSSHKKQINNQSVLAKEKLINLKNTIIKNYGGCCKFCNESRLPMLTIDHINNDGNLERKNNFFGREFYKNIIKNNYPNKYQILCYNCNCSKNMYYYINKDILNLYSKLSFDEWINLIESNLYQSLII